MTEQNTVLRIPFFKYWNGIVPEYVHEMFKASLCRYSTKSQMALDAPLRKTSVRQKKLILRRTKNVAQHRS